MLMCVLKCDSQARCPVSVELVNVAESCAFDGGVLEPGIYLGAVSGDAHNHDLGLGNAWSDASLAARRWAGLGLTPLSCCGPHVSCMVRVRQPRCGRGCG